MILMVEFQHIVNLMLQKYKQMAHSIQQNLLISMHTINKQKIILSDLTSRNNSNTTNFIQNIQEEENIDQGLVSKLRKIPKTNIQERKNAVIRFITKDINKSKQIQKFQSQKGNLPILEAALNLGKYGESSAFDQIINKSQFNSIQLKSPRLIQNNPFSQLLTLSKSKLLQQKKQISFVEYICKSPKNKNFLSNNKKNQNKSLTNSKVSMKVSVQFPKQLKKLKKQLYELPCITKDIQKQNTEPAINIKQKVKNIKDLCRSYSLQKKDDFFNQQQQNNLENSLMKALSLRKCKTQMSQQYKLPYISSNEKSKKSKFDSSRNKYFKSLSNILDQFSAKVSQNSSMMSIQLQKSHQQSLNLNSPIKTKKFGINLNTIETIEKNKKLENNQKVNRRNFWPYYKKFSPYNDKILEKRVKQMGVNLKEFLQFSQPPSQESKKIFQGIRILQKEQDDYLQKQAIYEQKHLSQEKYDLKLSNLKQSYIKDMRQFINNRRLNSIQRRKRDFEQNQNMCKRIVKLNQKLVLKIKSEQEKQMKSQQEFQLQVKNQENRNS